MTIHRPVARLAQLGLPLPNELSTEDIASLAFPNLASLRETDRAEYKIQLGDRQAFLRLVEEAIASGSLPARTETRPPGIYAQAIANRSGGPALPTIVHIIDRECFAQWFPTFDARALVPEDSVLTAWTSGPHEGTKRASIGAPQEPRKDTVSAIVDRGKQLQEQRSGTMPSFASVWASIAAKPPHGITYDSDTLSGMNGKLTKQNARRAFDRYFGKR